MLPGKNTHTHFDDKQVLLCNTLTFKVTAKSYTLHVYIACTFTLTFLAVPNLKTHDVEISNRYGLNFKAQTDHRF